MNHYPIFMFRQISKRLLHSGILPYYPLPGNPTSGILIASDWGHLRPDTGITYNPINFGGTGNHLGDFCYPIVDGRGHVAQYIMHDGTSTTAYTYSGGAV